jgi:hypothetical protein
MLKTSEETKKKLRKLRSVTGPIQDIARNTLVQGVIDRGAYIQFGSDMVVYNLWEALLYAKSYEDQGMYVAGTVEKALREIENG